MVEEGFDNGMVPLIDGMIWLERKSLDVSSKDVIITVIIFLMLQWLLLMKICYIYYDIIIKTNEKFNIPQSQLALYKYIKTYKRLILK